MYLIQLWNTAFIWLRKEIAIKFYIKDTKSKLFIFNILHIQKSSSTVVIYSCVCITGSTFIMGSTVVAYSCIENSQIELMFFTLSSTEVVNGDYNYVIKCDTLTQILNLTLILVLNLKIRGVQADILLRFSHVPIHCTNIGYNTLMPFQLNP